MGCTSSSVSKKPRDVEETVAERPTEEKAGADSVGSPGEEAEGTVSDHSLTLSVPLEQVGTDQIAMSFTDENPGDNPQSSSQDQDWMYETSHDNQDGDLIATYANLEGKPLSHFESHSSLASESLTSTPSKLDVGRSSLSSQLSQMPTPRAAHDAVGPMTPRFKSGKQGMASSAAVLMSLRESESY
jgi:hypothetical protein